MEISEKEYRDLVTRAVIAEEKNKFMTNEIKDIRNTLRQIQSTLDRFTTFFGSFNKTPESIAIPAYELCKSSPINHSYDGVTVAHKNDNTTDTITGGKAPALKFDTAVLNSVFPFGSSEMQALATMKEYEMSPLDLAKFSTKNKTEK